MGFHVCLGGLMMFMLSRDLEARAKSLEVAGSGF